MLDIKTLLEKTIKKHGFGKKIAEKKVKEIFSKVVERLFDSGLAYRVNPMHIKDGYLTVASLSATSIEQIKIKEKKIISKINEELAEEIVKKICYLS
ncbi:MAG: DciA family protein [bacterium]|nr:DciA family protein [bacterium]